MAKGETGAVLEVVRAGIQTTVQDLGRIGLRHLGVAKAGALDRYSLILANRLVGNADDSAGLEIVVGPMVLSFTRDAQIAICGADFDASLDGVSVAPGWRIRVRAGQVLRLHGAMKESRAYLAVDGGLDVPLVLGSRATDLQAHMGGWQGRALQNGDRLPLGEAGLSRKAIGVLQRTWIPEIRAIPGPEYEEFSCASRKAFWQHAWKSSVQSNRMGLRLQGSVLQREAQYDLLSHAVFPGMVQVPPNGQPIVLMADAQTTGGYPRLASVIGADLWKLAQTPPGQHFCFVQCDHAQALEAQERWSSELALLAWGMQRT